MSFSPFPKSVQLARPSKPAKLKEYKQATERARTAEGYLRCFKCRKSLLDREAQRHHVKHRSQGGDSSAKNLAVVCLSCHQKEHHFKVAK